MKKLVLILITLFLIVNVYSLDLKQMITKDKILHFGASFATTQLGYVSARTAGENKHNARLSATIFSVTVGLGKEIYDTKKKHPTGFSWSDLVADALGTGCALIVINNLQE